MTELKPCPFCGGEATAIDGSKQVWCSDCYADGPFTEEHIAAWNHRASDWISVEERLPETGRGVLVHGGMAYLSDQDRAWHSMIDGNRRIQWAVTHWMPLPEPPEKP